MAVIQQKDRVYELIVGDYKKSESATVLQDFQCKFDISKSSSNKDKTNSATIEIYNLDKDTIALLNQEYIAAVFSAGYIEIGVKRLFAGQIIDCTTRQQGADVITQIKMGSGYTELNHNIVSKLVAPGQTYEQAYEEVRKALGLDKGVYAGTNLNNQIISGYPLMGEPKRMLNKLSEASQTEWRVDNNALYINDMDGSISTNLNEVYIISEDTGLVDRPFKYVVSGDSKRSKKDKVKKKGVQWKMLLNGEVNPGEIVKVEFEEFSAYYKVDSVRHSGAYRDNDWYSEVFCSQKVKTDG